MIIGRAADLILAEEKPFRIFSHADTDVEVKRCMERASSTEKELYDLLVNTTDWNIKDLAPLISEYAVKWFERI